MALRASSGFQTKVDLSYKDVIRITTSPPAQRTRKEIQAVCDWIRKANPLFTDMDKDIVYSVMRGCKCQIMLRDTVVVKQGDKGDAFYIILRGQVSVFVKEVVEQKKSLLRELLESDEEPEKSPTPEEIPSPNNSDNEEEKVQKVNVPSVRQRFRKTLTKLKITQIIKPRMKKVVKKPDPRDELGMKVAQMNDGRSFGELALQNSDNKRAASCVTDTEVVFLVVARELYNKSIKSYQAKQLALIKGFISQHPFFSHWPSKLQSQVQNSVVQLKLEGGETVIQQGQTYNGIYFLIQGEIKVIINSQTHSKQYTEKSGTTAAAVDTKEDDSKNVHRILGHCEILRSLSMPHVHVKRREGYSAAELYQNNRHRNLCLSGPTIIFGDIEHVLGVSTYMQTITTEGTARIFHITKENLARLLKLASTTGQVVSVPTLTAMTEMAYNTWLNRIEKFATPTDDFSCLDRMVKDLSNHPLMRARNAEQPTQSKEEKLFESLMKAYLNNQAPLIAPCVEGGYAYRLSMQEKAALRRKQQARRGNVSLPRSLRPLRNRRIPRSITTLKAQIKKYQTSDVDIIVPPHRHSVDLEPITKARSIGQYHYNAESMPSVSTTSGGLITTVTKSAPALYEQNTTQESVLKTSSTLAGQMLENIVEQDEGVLVAPPIEQDEKEYVIQSQPRTAGILVTEVVPQMSEHVPHTNNGSKCPDNLSLIEGRTLKFYSEYLRGKLDAEYDKSLLDPEISHNNRQAEILERKLQRFIDPNNDLPDGSTTICRLRRLDETKNINILPGAKCLIERKPCRLLRKAFPLKAHEHVRRHIVEN